jgi:hypothetical protein
VRVGYEPQFGGRFEATLRMLRNDSFYSAIPYTHEYLGSLSYAHPWRGYAVGGQVDAGRDVFGDRYARLSAFLRLGDALAGGGAGADEEEEPSDNATPGQSSTVFVDVGANANRLREDIVVTTPPIKTDLNYGAHLGLGARRTVTVHQDLGMRLDADQVNGKLLLGVRAIDYRWRFDNPLALDAFVGAARYSLGTPAMGWYMGAGPEWRGILPGWDLAATARYGMKLARLRVLPTDPRQGYRIDSFYDVYSLALSLSHKL